ncbi:MULTISPECIES: ParB N-terminal domain-containing protein [unclassified Bradyrhizobium]|uniref:ParB N-terminal domain-containing protein n=1 Tax=unclassified Bradyrhizobium TaxID=2631580 RepID=UPI00188A4D8D|nr:MULTISPECIES: ParB N-terminal domain-containing protein [unclassified Bradyrhizobium]MDN4983838.1 ParB N-terminal domain-containing protein [Bradyrhizobium sp. WYCCWR 13022]QOZ56124.1 chromosome partitioning protein ParB [Bradyrhizobium sp. CCBAU 53338]
MPKAESFPIEKIHIPAKRSRALQPERVRELAESILETGQQAPISVRVDKDQFILVEGLHRLEACRALGETSVIAVVVQAESPQHRRLLSDSTELEAERDKMVRLKQLRLEREAAAAVAVPSAKSGASPPRPKRTAAVSRPGPQTLSQWIARQKSDGSRY